MTTAVVRTHTSPPSSSDDAIVATVSVSKQQTTPGETSPSTTDNEHHLAVGTSPDGHTSVDAGHADVQYDENNNNNNTETLASTTSTSTTASSTSSPSTKKRLTRSTSTPTRTTSVHKKENFAKRRRVSFEAAEIVEFEPTVFTTTVTSGGIPLGMSLEERSRSRRRLDSWEMERKDVRIGRQNYMEEGYLDPNERESILSSAGCAEHAMLSVEAEVNQIIQHRRESNELDFDFLYGLVSIGEGTGEDDEEDDEEDEEEEEEEEEEEIEEVQLMSDPTPEDDSDDR